MIFNQEKSAQSVSKRVTIFLSDLFLQGGYNNTSGPQFQPQQAGIEQGICLGVTWQLPLMASKLHCLRSLALAG